MNESEREQTEYKNTDKCEEQSFGLRDINHFHTQESEVPMKYAEEANMFIWAIEREDIHMVEFHFQHVFGLLPQGKEKFHFDMERSMKYDILDGMDEHAEFDVRQDAYLLMRAKSYRNEGRVAIGIHKSHIEDIEDYLDWLTESIRTTAAEHSLKMKQEFLEHGHPYGTG